MVVVAVSAAYVIRFKLDNNANGIPPGFAYPPPNHPSVVVPLAAKPLLFATDNGPRLPAAAVSVA